LDWNISLEENGECLIMSNEQKIQKIISHEMVEVRKMKKAELLRLVEELMGDVLREMDDFTINDISAEV
jgi:hypothetical protein